MPERELTPTRSAFLELKEERAGMQDGYAFLDEKRLILASELLAELARYEQEAQEFRRVQERAGAALRAAIARHGLEGLELYPKAAAPCHALKVARRSVLGVTMQAAAWEAAEEEKPPPAVNASPEADACRAAYGEVVKHAAALAVRAGNLERLRREYARTARRARALEDVLLPEIDDTLGTIEAALEELEREEALRARQAPKVR